MKENHPIALFNGPVATSNGLFRISDLAVEDARALLNNSEYISAVGHESTAEILSEILGVKIEMNRIQFHQKVGQKAIIFKLNERPPEGVIYNRKQLEDIGYSLRLMERIE